MELYGSNGDMQGMIRHEIVSVITIFLNAESFLAEAVESVFSQTHLQWELLLVDDGSTDASTNLAQRYAEEHPGSVRYLEHPGHTNLGMSAARNLGIRHAQGAYIAFLDADDVWLPQKLERQLDLLRRHPGADLVYGPSRLWYSWSGRPDDMRRDTRRRLGVRAGSVIAPPRMLKGFLKNRIPTPATCSVLLRRDAVARVGGFEEQFRGLYEDQAFFAKIFHTSTILPWKESWDLYRQHSGSSCARAEESGEYHSELPNPAHRSFLIWLDNYMSEQGLEDEGLRKLIKRRLWLYRHPLLHVTRTRLRLASGKAAGLLTEGGHSLAFAVGRRVLPHSLRQWMWSRWLNQSP